MKILIAEDEKPTAEALQKEIQRLRSNSQFLPICDTVRGVVQALKKEEPDLIFLDISLADGQVFEAFEHVTISCPIIFVTAYDEFALKSFEVLSIDYLLKPVTTEKLKHALSKYDQLTLLKEDEVIKVLDENLVKRGFKNRFLVKVGHHLIPIEAKDIMYFQADLKWTYLVTEENTKHLINFNLTDLEELLDPSMFFRLNRQFIISRPMIRSLESFTKGQVIAHLNMSVESQKVSRVQTRLLKDWLS